MKTGFILLSKDEIALLLKAPAIISFLAAIGTGAIKIAHLKTFTSCRLLTSYYKEAERVFERNYEMITHQYIPFDEVSRTGIQIETDSVNNIIEKLDPEFA